MRRSVRPGALLAEQTGPRFADLRCPDSQVGEATGRRPRHL